jgi:hypothetical protein
MKHLLTLAVLVIRIMASAQNNVKPEVKSLPTIKDSTLTVDTSVVKIIQIGASKISVADIFSPFVVTGMVDTVKVSNMLYKVGDNIKMAVSGYHIYFRQVGVRNGKIVATLTDWEQVGALDDKKKPVQMVPPTKITNK